MVTESRFQNLGEAGVKDSHAFSIQTLTHTCSDTVFNWKIINSLAPPSQKLQFWYSAAVRVLSWHTAEVIYLTETRKKYCYYE